MRFRRPLDNPIRSEPQENNRYRFWAEISERDYRVATGHATLYWDTGWNDVLATLSVGRYLAKDVGVTV